MIQKNKNNLLYIMFYNKLISNLNIFARVMIHFVEGLTCGYYCFKANSTNVSTENNAIYHDI